MGMRLLVINFFFHRRQLAVGVEEADLTGFHGLRVLGYNQTKHALGEDMAVAHGLWKSTAHRRYDRFSLSRVARIPAAVAGIDEAEAVVPDDVERIARSPAERLVRGRRSGGVPAIANDEGDEDSGSSSEQSEAPPSPAEELRVDLLPPGWEELRRRAPSGKKYSVFSGPGGVRVRSRPEAWRVHELGVEVRAEAGADARLPVRPGGAAVSSPVVAAVVREEGEAAGQRFPDSLVDYVHYYDRPSSRRPPRERAGR